MKPEQGKDLKPARRKWEKGGQGEGQGKEGDNGSEGRDGKEREKASGHLTRTPRVPEVTRLQGQRPLPRDMSRGKAMGVSGPMQNIPPNSSRYTFFSHWNILQLRSFVRPQNKP